MFDESTFLDSTVEGSSSTEFVVVPEGEYTGLVKKIAVRSGESDKGPWAVLDVTWGIDDPAVIVETGLDNPSARQSIFLDITDTGGLALGKGKNINLGRLREAVGQNTEGPWSPSMLEGSVAIIKVEHRLYEGMTYADVKSVAEV